MSETAADRFLSDHGVNDVAPAVRDARENFRGGQAEYMQGEHDRACSRLEAFWKTYPAGSDVWSKPDSTVYEQLRTNGIFLGEPPCYSALRMLTEAVQWRVRSRPLDDNARRPASVPVALTIVLVGLAEGTQPRSQAELEANRGDPVSLALEPALLADEFRIIRQSLGLFGEYVSAITDGRLALRVECLTLPQLTLAVSVRAGKPWYAGPADGALGRVWESVPAGVKNQTDWWWVICPSVVPEQYADFAAEEFVTGGMSRGPDGASPCFLSDDRSLSGSRRISATASIPTSSARPICRSGSSMSSSSTCLVCIPNSGSRRRAISGSIARRGRRTFRVLWSPTTTRRRSTRC